MDNFINNGSPLQDNMGGFGGPQQPKKDLSTVSMVCGIISIVIGCCCCLGPVSGIVAIITGIMSLKNMTPNKGKATAGIIMGSVSLLLFVISFIVNSVTGFSSSFMEGFMEGLEGCIRFF